jgi:hypothetical protein
MAIAMDYRVGNLEAAMAEMMRQAARTSQEVAQTSREMREFKEEMGEFKDEMSEFKDEMGEAAARSEREMREFKEEMRLFRDQLNKKWGELSNKLGTMVEDLVAPSVPRILRETVGCPDDQLEVMHVRTVKRSPLDRGRVQEFDVVAACGEYALINETKSSLSPEKISEFVALLGCVREFFPEFADKKVIGAIGSLYVDASLVACGERAGLIVLGFGDDVMQVLNSEGFKPKEF